MAKIVEDKDLNPIKKTKTKFEIVEEVKSAVTEPGLDKIMDIGDSPSLVIMEERTGGDDFLKTSQVQQPQQQPQPDPTLSTQQPQQTYFEGQPPNINSPKEFTIQNPEDAIIEKQRILKQQQEQEIAKEVSKESGNMMADLLVDGFGMITPELANSYYSINEVAIKGFERENKVPEGTLAEVKRWNKDHKDMVKFTKEQRNLIHTPLVKVLEIHSVKADPTTMLIIGLCIVCFMMYMSARTIKKDGDEMVANLIEGYERRRRAMDAEKAKEKEAPFVETEEAFPNNVN